MTASKDQKRSKTGKYLTLWQAFKKRIKGWSSSDDRLLKKLAPAKFAHEDLIRNTSELLCHLRDYLLMPGEPNVRLDPKWLADKLKIGEREMLDALAYAVRDGLVELHWEVYCPACGKRPAEYDSLNEAQCALHCPACGNNFDLHLDRDVRVTFSAAENLRRARTDKDNESSADAGPRSATRGLDLLLSPAFHKLFAGEAPSPNESLRIGRVVILFTDLRGSTAIYAERGDPRAYRMVREHFDILAAAIERHKGVLIKTIGDSVMASFAASADAVRAVAEAQSALRNRTAQTEDDLILKAGIHVGACLAVNLNDRLDFFGTAVNTAARVQNLSRGGDLVVTSETFAELELANLNISLIENFDSELRGLPAPVHVYRFGFCDRSDVLK